MLYFNKVNLTNIFKYFFIHNSESTLIHSIIVFEIAEQLAILLNLNQETIQDLKYACLLHDIGKVAIPEEILNKKEPLNRDEYELIKAHAIIGYKILSEMKLYKIRDIAAFHHEKLNGKGYPFGLTAKEISLETRLLTISDIVSALLYERPYKEPFQKEKIIEILHSMIDNNEIDKDITVLLINNYDLIIYNAEHNLGLINQYNKFKYQLQEEKKSSYIY